MWWCDMAQTFEYPKVSDLVEYLLTLPQGNRIIIRDADTDWQITTIHIEIDSCIDYRLKSKEKFCTVVLYGKYIEMDGY